MPVGLFMSQNVNLSTSSGGSTSASSSSCADSTVGRELLLRKLALAPNNKSTECLSKYLSQFGNDQFLLVDYETLKRPRSPPQLNNIFNNNSINSIMYEPENYMNKIDNFEDCIHLNTNNNLNNNNNINNNNKSSFSISPNNSSSIDLSNTNEYMAATNLLLTPACSSSSSSSSSSSCSSSSYSYGSQPVDRIPSECQILLAPSEPVRNNIDYAIDAVLAKCRSDSGDEDADHEFNVLDSSTSSLSLPPQQPPQPAAVKSKSNKKTRLETKPQVSPAPASDIMLSVVAPVTSSFNSTVSSPGQPMSKSSKARTSYISSLIANRERGTPKEDEITAPTPPPPPPQPSTITTTANEDEKQRRISQNILTILANNVQPNPPTPILSESHDTHPNHQTNEMDFVINYQQQQQQQQCQMNDNFSYRPLGQPNHLEENRLGNEHTSAYMECVNLKRLLSQPIEATNGVHAASNSQLYGDMQQILTESAFDNVKITVKSVLTSTEFDASSQQSSGCIRAAVVVPPVQADVVVAAAATAMVVEAKESSKPAVKGPKRKRAINKNTSAAKSRQQAQSKPVQSSESDKTISQNCQTSSTTHSTSTSTDKSKTKKLKTIADIVKHNNESQRHKQLAETVTTPQQQQQQSLILAPPPPPAPLHLEPNQCSEVIEDKFSLKSDITNNLTLTWLNNNTNNNELLKDLNYSINYEQPPQQQQQQIKSEALFHESHLTGDMSSMNIDRLIELEFNNVNESAGHHSHHHQSIDKFIDLDDIDLNPLDCYRHNNNNTNNVTNSNMMSSNLGAGCNNANSNHLDEFNFQFSVCSSSSSGFSEPSNFSSCSSQTGAGYANLNNVIGNYVFSSESESSPIGVAYQYEQTYMNSPAANNNSSPSLRQPMKQHDLLMHSNVIDWGMSEQYTSAAQAAAVNLNFKSEQENFEHHHHNMFANLSFLNDEIKL